MKGTYKKVYDALYEVQYGEFPRTIYDTILIKKISYKDIDADVVCQMKNVEKVRDAILDKRVDARHALSLGIPLNEFLPMVQEIDVLLETLKDDEYLLESMIVRLIKKEDTEHE